MPVYDRRARLPISNILREGMRPGAVAFPDGDLVDADGKVVDYCLWCDTGTGEAECYVREGDRFVTDPQTHRIVTQLSIRPAPLSVVPVRKPGAGLSEVKKGRGRKR